jgi:CheY-like chemotaxis protein
MLINIYYHYLTEVTKEARRILVLDDTRDVSSRIKIALEKKGEHRTERYKVDTYNDPMWVLENFKAGLYDLFLIDFLMATTSNYKLCNKVRQTDNKVKICYMSETYENYEEAKKIFPKVEIKCFIPKSAKISDLVKRIKEELKL